jgi:hypothetical protein
VNKFSEAKLTEGRLQAKGPLTVEPGQSAEHMHFLVCQGNVVARGSAHISNGAWSGFADDATGLHQGDAHGFGIAIVIDETERPGFETVTWFEPIQIT